MKKITFLLMLLAVTFGSAQSPTDNATTPPARDAGDVISIFSDAYSDVAGSDFNPNWGQAGFGTANTAFDPGTGNLVLGYPNFNYQGNQFGSTQNIAAMEFLHVDIWINGSFNPNVFVISSGGEIAHPITNAGSGTWTSVDIPVSGITGDTSAAIQFKFDNGNGSTDAIYVDNLYFWRAAVDPMTDATLSDLQVDGSSIAGFGPGTTDYTIELPAGTTIVPQITSATTTNENATASISQASAIPGDATVTVTAENGTDMGTYTVSMVAVGPSVAAPTPPNRTSANVISLFSDAYTDVNVTEWSTSWDDSSIEDVVVAGNAAKKISFGNFLGVEFDNFDASGMSHFHMDFYTDNMDLVGKVLNPKWSEHGGVGSEQSAFLLTYLPTTSGAWVSIDVPLTDFDGAPQTRTDLSQFILTSNLGTVYIDNLYLHNNNLSTDEFASTNFKVYPNPTIDNWNIESNTIISSITVYDILGKQVMALTPNSNDVEINTSTIKTGIYFARIEGVNGSKTVKLIKE